jgi:diacylglycerol kinase (ATP)
MCFFITVVVDSLLKNVIKTKDAVFYSLSGLKFLLNERAFRHELYLGFLLIIIELFRKTPAAMLLYMFSSYVIVLISEAANTAIESTIDRISASQHELSKRAKDIGSAAVFISIVHLVAVWIVSWFI